MKNLVIRGGDLSYLQLYLTPEKTESIKYF